VVESKGGDIQLSELPAVKRKKKLPLARPRSRIGRGGSLRHRAGKEQKKKREEDPRGCVIQLTAGGITCGLGTGGGRRGVKFKLAEREGRAGGTIGEGGRS